MGVKLINTSSNSLEKFSSISRILKVINESEIELGPKEIAEKAHVDRSTTRGHLRRLLKEGKVIQPYPSAYCSKITYGMMFAPLRIHNVIVTAEAPWLDFSDDIEELAGSVKVRVQFGIERHKVTGRISCDGGMDRNSVIFALSRFYDMVKKRTGHDLDQVVVRTFEVNRDVQGVTLDGVKCYTKKGLFETIERLYQKEDDVVRYEHKVSTPMTVDEFTALIQGGVSTYNLQQGLFMLMQEVRKMTEALKFNNSVLAQVLRTQNAILNKRFDGGTDSSRPLEKGDSQ